MVRFRLTEMFVLTIALILITSNIGCGGGNSKESNLSAKTAPSETGISGELLVDDLSKITLQSSSFEVKQSGSFTILLLFSQAFPKTVEFNWTMSGNDTSFLQTFTGTFFIQKGENSGQLTINPNPANPTYVTKLYLLNLTPSENSLTIPANLTLTLIDDRILAQPTSTPTPVAPSISIQSPTNGLVLNSTSYLNPLTVSGICGANEEGRAITIKVNETPSGTSTTCTNSAYTTTVDLSAISDGTITLTAHITNSSGLNSTMTPTSITKDTTPPSLITFTSPSSSTVTLNSTYSFGWTPSQDLGAGATGILDYSVTLYHSTMCTGNPLSTLTIPAGSPLLFEATMTDGDYSIQVSARDTAGNSTANNPCSQSVSYNRPPTATNDTLFVMKNASATNYNVLSNDSDPDSDTLTVQSTSQGTGGGSVVLNSDSTITYTPTSGFQGLESFTYTLSDGRGGTATGTVSTKVMTPYTWTGMAGTTNWNDSANWCGTVNAQNNQCNGITGFPNSSTTATHRAVFDGTCDSNCSPLTNLNVAVYGLELNNGYAGTLSQGAGYTLTVGAGGWKQSAGTFIGSNASITLNLYGDGLGKFLFTGGTFTSTSGLFKIRHAASNDATTGGASEELFNMSAAATFHHHSGTLQFDGVDSWYAATDYQVNVPSGLSFFNVTLSGYNNYSTGVSLRGFGSVTVENNFTHQSSQLLSGNWNIYGNATFNAESVHSVPSNGTVTFKGTNNQTYSFSGSGTNFTGRVDVDKQGGTISAAAGTTTFAAAEFHLMSGNFEAPTGTMAVGFLTSAGTAGSRTFFEVTANGTFSHNNGTVTFKGQDSWTGFSIYTIDVNANLILNNVKISGYPASYGTGHTVASGDTITVLNNFEHIQGTLGGQWQLQGNYSSSASVTNGSYTGTASLTFSGNNNQTVFISSGNIPSGSIQINKSSGSSVQLLSNWSPSNGTQDLSLISGDLLLNGFSLAIGRTLTLSSGTTLSQQSGSLSYGSLINNGTIQ